MGVDLTVPMPGHAVGAEVRCVCHRVCACVCLELGRTMQHAEAVLADVARLHDLVRDHDVMFILTDTRERCACGRATAAALSCDAHPARLPLTLLVVAAAGCRRSSASQ